MWKKIEGYPKKNDYVWCKYNKKEYTGIVTGHVVRFKTGYVAMELKYGNVKWMPWTSKITYYRKEA